MHTTYVPHHITLLLYYTPRYLLAPHAGVPHMSCLSFSAGANERRYFIVEPRATSFLHVITKFEHTMLAWLPANLSIHAHATLKHFADLTLLPSGHLVRICPCTYGHIYTHAAHTSRRLLYYYHACLPNASVSYTVVTGRAHACRHA